MPRGMELYALQDAPRLGWLKSFIQGGGFMGVQVILHDANVFGVGIHLIDQPLNTVGIIDLGAMLRHLHMTPACQRRGR